MGILNKAKELDLNRREMITECRNSEIEIHEKFDRDVLGESGRNIKTILSTRFNHIDDNGEPFFSISAAITLKEIDQFYEEVTEWVRSVKEDLNDS